MADNPLESLVTQTQVQSVEITPPDSKPPESSSQSEPTELELIAMEMGWNPDKDTVGDQWVDARTYIKRTHDIQKTQARTIKDTSRKLEKVLSSVDSLKAHYERVAQSQQEKYDREIATLKAERRVAIAENDPAKVDELDSQIDSLKEAKAKTSQIPDTPPVSIDPVFEEWADENPWFGDDGDKEMSAFAKKRARLYRVQEIRDDALYRETMDEITREVKKEFPEKFGKGKRQTVTPPAGGVEGGRPSGSSPTRTPTYKDLDPEHRAIYDNFVNMLGLDGKQIIQQWVDIGEIK